MEIKLKSVTRNGKVQMMYSSNPKPKTKIEHKRHLSGRSLHNETVRTQQKKVPEKETSKMRKLSEEANIEDEDFPEEEPICNKIINLTVPKGNLTAMTARNPPAQAFSEFPLPKNDI